MDQYCTELRLYRHRLRAGPRVPRKFSQGPRPNTSALRSKHSNVNIRTKSATVYRRKAMTTPTRSAVRKAHLTPPVRKEGNQSSFLDTEESHGNTAGWEITDR